MNHPWTIPAAFVFSAISLALMLLFIFPEIIGKILHPRRRERRGFDVKMRDDEQH